MTLRPIVFALALSAVASAPALAVEERAFQARTVGDLATLCSASPRTPQDTAALNFCEGFAQGAIDVELGRDRAAGGSAPFCFPRPTPSRISTLREFVNWARAEPNRVGEPAAKGLFRYLGERFPCPAK